MNRYTIKDVASAAGVSTALVSRILNAPLDADGIPDCDASKETALRVLDIVKKLGYRQNKAAASLRKGQGKRIGVIIPDISHPYFSQMARHFENLANIDGYAVRFGSSTDSASKMENILQDFLQDNVDGIIIVPGIQCSAQIEAMIKESVPTILVVRDLPEIESIGRVLTDNSTATEMAINHLLECGYKKIEMISTNHRLSIIEERERLFTEYMSSKGLTTRIHLQDSKNIKDSTYYILMDAVRRGVEALYCPSANIPLVCIKLCYENNIRIPEDIAILGYDGGEQYTLTSPDITQISFSREDVAKNAYEMLLKAISGQETSKGTIYITPSLVPGGSTLPQNTANHGTTGNIKNKILSELESLKNLVSQMQTDK